MNKVAPGPIKFDYPEWMLKLEEWPGKIAGLWHAFELSTDPKEPWTLPALPGCYAIFSGGVLIYVGQSQNVYKRIQGHKIRRYRGEIHTPWGTYPSVVIKVRRPIKYGDWAMVELRLIRRLQPAGNSTFCELSKLSPMLLNPFLKCWRAPFKTNISAQAQAGNALVTRRPLSSSRTHPRFRHVPALRQFYGVNDFAGHAPSLAISPAGR